MSETPPVPRPDQPAGASAVPAAAPATVSASAVAPQTFRIAGGLLVLAGLLHAGSYLVSLELAIVSGVLQSLALLAVFVVFLRAGFPHRGTVPRVLTIALIAVYAVAAVSLLFIATELFLPLTIGLGLVTLALGIAFGVVTMRTPGITPQLARLPIGLYLALLLLGQAASRLGLEWAGILPALAYLLVGALFIAFATRGPVPAPAVSAPPAPPAA